MATSGAKLVSFRITLQILSSPDSSCIASPKTSQNYHLERTTATFLCLLCSDQKAMQERLTTQVSSKLSQEVKAQLERTVSAEMKRSIVPCESLITRVSNLESSVQPFSVHKRM